MKQAAAALAMVAAGFTSTALAQAPSITLDTGPNVSSNGQTDWLGVGNPSYRYWVAQGIQDGSIAQGPAANQQETNIGILPTVGPNGEVAFRMQWHWPDPDPDPNSHPVKAYPAILTGAKPGDYQELIPGNAAACDCPGGSYIRYLAQGTDTYNQPDRPDAAGGYGPTPGTFLPQPAPIASLNSSFKWAHNAPPTGFGHLAYDIWLQNTPVQKHGWDPTILSHEVMINLDRWGGYDNPVNPAWYDHDVTIDGIHFKVYVKPVVSWPFIVFAPDQDVSINNTTLDLAKFINHVVTYPGWSQGPEYVVSVELGSEMETGTADLTVWNYSVTGAPQTKVQAENASWSGTGVAVHTDLAGYEGSGFLGPFSNAGDQMTTTFTGVTAGTYNVNIRYHAWGDEQNNVVVNGSSQSIVFPVTGSNWGVKTLSGVTLTSGSNTVAITKDWGYVDVDYMEIVPVPSAMRIQSENASWSGTGVAVHNDLAGYEGSGFLGTFSNAGDQMTATFSNVTAGTYTVNIRYHAWGDEQNNVVVNGSSQNLLFPVTGSNWGVKTLSGVTLTSGSNTIAITKDWGYVDVDWIEIVP